MTCVYLCCLILLHTDLRSFPTYRQWDVPLVASEMTWVISWAFCKVCRISCAAEHWSEVLHTFFHAIHAIYDASMLNAEENQCHPMSKRSKLHSFPLSHPLVKPMKTSKDMGGGSINGCIPKSSILIGFSLINHPFLGTPIISKTVDAKHGSTALTWMKPALAACSEWDSRQIQQTSTLVQHPWKI